MIMIQSVHVHVDSIMLHSLFLLAAYLVSRFLVTDHDAYLPCTTNLLDLACKIALFLFNYSYKNYNESSRKLCRVRARSYGLVYEMPVCNQPYTMYNLAVNLAVNYLCCFSAIKVFLAVPSRLPSRSLVVVQVS